MGACAGAAKTKAQQHKSLSSIKVCITAYIWNKEAHNLFDFESKQCVTKDIEIDFTSTISTQDKEIMALTDKVSQGNLIFCKEYVKNSTQILKFNFDNNVATIESISNKQDHRIWANLEFDSIDQWELRLHDIIKLGRVRIQLIDYQILSDQENIVNKGQQQENDQNLNEITEEDIESKDYENEVNQCRVCFSKKATKKNPLMNPCNCEGSVKYIHLKCLQSWIHSQIKTKKSENSTQYIWNKFECEICKSQLKNSYVYENSTYSILNIKRPKTSFMMWKVTNDDKGKEGMIYVLELNDKSEIRLGRMPDSDIKLKDISVSRNHAFIKVVDENNKKKLILQDNNSKFGTLLYAQWKDLLQYSLEKAPQRILYQIGRLLVYMSIKPKEKVANNQSVYKHPLGVQVIPLNQIQFEDIDTKNPNFNEDCQCSFQTHNILSFNEVVICEPRKQEAVQEKIAGYEDQQSEDEIPQENPVQIHRREYKKD